VLIAATFALVMWGSALSVAWQVAGVGLVLFTLTTLGGLLELRRWAPALEAARWVAVAGAGALAVLQHTLSG